MNRAIYVGVDLSVLQKLDPLSRTERHFDRTFTPPRRRRCRTGLDN